MEYYVHPSAEVAAQVTIGKNSSIWNLTKIREGARIGKNCILGKNVYIDCDVTVGSDCKIQNNSSLYRGTVLEDGVFIGPHVICTNDKYPRAINPDGRLKDVTDWEVGPILVKYGASVGAGVIILPGVVIGRFALIGAGAIVTKNVPDMALVYGNPARIVGYVDETGRLQKRV